METIEIQINNEAIDDIIILKLLPKTHVESYLEAREIFNFLTEYVSAEVYHELVRLMFNNEISRQSVFKIEIKD